jgi:hypothetical protein
MMSHFAVEQANVANLSKAAPVRIKAKGINVPQIQLAVFANFFPS